MLRIGVDLIEISRVKEALERHGQRFLDRCFTPAEQAHCEGAAHRLAARFAAKEAVGKALGTGIGAVKWIEIEVNSDAQGRPTLHLHGDAARIAADLAIRSWEVSLSHNRDMAIAFVVGWGG
ncbi:MAG: holo-ACP synthase [Anaerolineae bacterium]|nr:holo-ACP synthase [Anaerolineae bacterium]CAG0995824.1 holo-[acyl-carrier protein] synthase [Anaerolineae bacterium]